MKKATEVKLGVLINPNFQRVLRSIVETEKPVKAKAAYAISRILSTVQSEQDRYNEIRTKLIEKFCKKDEEGKLAIDESGNATFESDEARAEFSKELSELTEVMVEVSQINVADIEAYEIKPIDMLAIRDIMYEN